MHGTLADHSGSHALSNHPPHPARRPAALGVAAPAHAVEVGVVKSLDNTLPAAETTHGLKAGWIRLWADWEVGGAGAGPVAAGRHQQLQPRGQAAKAKGLKVLMVVVNSPAWASGGKGGIAPPRDPPTSAAPRASSPKRVPGVDAWELWNEEDTERWFAGGPDPAKYTAMVKSAYKAIKAVQPRDVVVTGATTGNNYAFIEQLYAHGLKGHFDAIGTHTDTACLVDGPSRMYREPDGRLGRYIFSSYRETTRS